MFLFRRSIFVLLFLFVIFTVIMGIVISKENGESPDSADVAMNTMTIIENTDEYTPQDPVARIDGVDLSKDDFLDFVEAMQGIRVNVFLSEKLLEDYLHSYLIYNSLSKKATEQGLDLSPESQKELEILEVMTLANIFEEAELPISVDELEMQRGMLDINLSDDLLVFFASKDLSMFKESEIREDEETRNYILNIYKGLLVKAEQAKVARLDQKELYQQKWAWEKVQYLSNLYIRDYLQQLPRTDEDVAIAVEQWVIDQDFSEYKVAHIYLDGPEVAQQVLDKINKQELTFEEAAREYSIDESSKLVGGKVANGEWVTFPNKTHPFRAALGDLQEGEMTTDIIKGVNGYHIIKLEARQKGGIPEYMDVSRVEKQAWEEQKLSELYESIKYNNDIFEPVTYFV